MINLNLQEFNEKIEKAERECRYLCSSQISHANRLIFEGIIESIKLLAEELKSHYHYEEEDIEQY